MSDFDRIAISGKMCSGKTTVANMLERDLGYIRLFFADELKTLCRDIALYNKVAAAGLELAARKPILEIIWDDAQRITTTDEEYAAAMNQILFIMEEFREVTHYDPNSDKKSNEVRRMLQQVGTEYMRHNVNDNIWVNALEKQIKKWEPAKLVVDDMRYPNEFEMLRKNGFVMVRLSVSRDVQQKRLSKLYGSIDESKFVHPSETALDHMIFDYVIDADQPAEEMLKDIRSLLGGK